MGFFIPAPSSQARLSEEEAGMKNKLMTQESGFCSLSTKAHPRDHEIIQYTRLSEEWAEMKKTA